MKEIILPNPLSNEDMQALRTIWPNRYIDNYVIFNGDTKIVCYVPVDEEHQKKLDEWLTTVKNNGGKVIDH